MKKFGLIEYPKKESLSYKVFNSYFKAANIKATYEDIVIEPSEFENKIQNYIQNYDGLNITVPFKEVVIKYIDIIEDAKEINAVNCIYKNKGYNTDWKGFYNSLKFPLVEPILLIGAGGASKSIVYALYKKGVKEIYLTNRTKEKAEKLKKFFSDKIEIKVEPFENLKSIVRSSKTLINATSIGMFQESFDLEENDLSNLSLIYDIVYNHTPLQKTAQKLKINCLDGKNFWFYQAVENLKIWDIYNEEIFNGVFKKVVRGE